MVTQVNNDINKIYEQFEAMEETARELERNGITGPLPYNEEIGNIFDEYIIALFGPALKELEKH